MAKHNILSEDDFNEINVQLETLTDLDEQLRLATQAGIDVIELKKQSSESRTQLNRLRQTYFPGRN